MRTLARTESKRTLTRRVYSTGSSNLIGSYPLFVDMISPSAIIKGDKKSPYPWSYTIEDFDRFNGVAVDRQGSYGGAMQPLYSSFTGPLQGLASTNPYDYNNSAVAYNAALDRLNQKVRGGLDLSVAMAESSATFRMVRALTKAKRYFSGIGSKRWANEWLQLQYGWKPLLSDIYGAADEITNVSMDMMRFKGRAGYGKDASVGRLTPSYVDISGVSNYTDGPVSTMSKVKTFNACEIVVNLKYPTTVQQLARWTSLNPLSIAWELVPYSFVVDWFVDIGSYMRNLETSVIYNSAFSSGYKSELRVVNYFDDANYNYGGNNYFTRVVKVGAVGKGRLITFSRTLLTSYPSPRRPTINTDLSSSRLLSAAALLRQMLRF